MEEWHDLVEDSDESDNENLVDRMNAIIDGAGDGDSENSDDDLEDGGGGELFQFMTGMVAGTNDRILSRDIPERMLLRSVPVTHTVDSYALDDEAEWIYREAFCKPSISVQDAHLSPEEKERARKGPQTIGKIRKAVDLMKDQAFEVPFIAFYRKEDVLPELNIDDLWKVYKFDAKWYQLRQRKENLLSLFKKMRNYQSDQMIKGPLPDSVRVIADRDFERLRNVQTSEELDDVLRHFMLYYAHDIPAMHDAVSDKEKEEQKKPAQEVEPEKELDEYVEDPIITGPYAACKKAGLDVFAKKFGLTPEQFAENLRDNHQHHEVQQEPAYPLALAQDFPQYQTPEEVLNAVKLMVAVQLAREPLVKKSVREVYMQKAKVNVKPTEKGIEIINEAHPVYTMKDLKDKPVRELVGDQFLRLTMAEKDQLVAITLSSTIEGSAGGDYLDQVKQLYIRNESGKRVQAWNDLRAAAVEMALNDLVFPELRNELRANLIAEAKESVMRACCRKMFDWIKIAPYTCSYPGKSDEWDTSKGLRVMSVSYVRDDAQVAFACLIAPDGECTERLMLPHLLKRKDSPNEEERVRKEADLLAIKKFLSKTKPHVIAVGGESKQALMIADDFKECVAILVEEEQFPPIAVEIVDNNLAKVYANSNQGAADFPDYPSLLREGVSLGRRLQDPLVEFSQLCNADNEILNLNFHQLQDQLPREELLENIHIEFINRVNEVGVDINKIIQREYSGNLLQFVSGLGPKKAQALIDKLKRENMRLENRAQLVIVAHTGPKVFINSCGFLKINTESLGNDTKSYVEVLDGTRIHPELYEWTRKMAVRAMGYHDNDRFHAQVVDEVVKVPEKLHDVDLEALAEEMKSAGHGNKFLTLCDMRDELICRYRDLRIPYQSPSPEELEDMLNKEERVSGRVDMEHSSDEHMAGSEKPTATAQTTRSCEIL